MNQPLQKIEPASALAPAQPQSESGALIHMIERVARDPSVDIERMDRLMQMRRELKAQEAKDAWDAAMTAAQAEMRPVAADANNPQTKSKYASYAALDRALRPIYTKHGFSLSFNEGDCPKPDHVRVLCDVSAHGHTRPYKVDMPADGKGAKGGDVMTKTHATGSAFSYGMRYLLKMIFNIAVGDDDGNAAGGKVISDAQAEQIKQMTADFDTDAMAALLKYVGAESIESIPADRYARATYAIGIRKGKTKGTAE